MKPVSFEVTLEDAGLIERIVKRADVAHRETIGRRMTEDERVSLEMDLTAVHANGCPLRLQELLDADNFNFGHDVFGIARHIDRRTGKLRNHFRPRFAVPARRRVL